MSVLILSCKWGLAIGQMGKHLCLLSVTSWKRNENRNSALKGKLRKTFYLNQLHFCLRDPLKSSVFMTS